MTTSQPSLPKWILGVSGLFALLELVVALSLAFSPQAFLDDVDLTAKGVNYLIYMWAVRQFALGVILALATIKRSNPMLTTAWVFMLVMFLGDLIVGFVQKNNSLIIAALVMAVVASFLIFALNKRK